MKLLYTSNEVHDAIKELLSSPTQGDQRVVLVAYLGKHAESYLPHPNELRVICSMEPPTSSSAIIRLRKRGALVEQSDQLHMKVYWSNRRGAVICSANASQRALGRRGLKEAGVMLDRGAVDLDRLLKYVQSRPILDADLRNLKRNEDRFAIGRWSHPKPAEGSAALSLREWLEDPIERWKLGPYEGDCSTAKAARSEARERFGVRDVAGFVNAAKGHFSAKDWILKFDLSAPESSRWMYVDFLTKVAPADREAYERKFPYQAVQARPNNHCGDPPFSLNDRATRHAIACAVRDFGVDRINKLPTRHVPKEFERLLNKYAID